LLKLTTARVLAQYRGLWLVATPDSEPELVTARGKLPETPVTGDHVRLDESGTIAEILPRHGVIVRRAPGEAADGQVLAVNVDLALITEPLPDPNERRLERFAALATSGGAPVALVLTKADLDEEGYAKATQLGRRLGAADAVAVSVRTGEGIDVIRGLLDPGATAVLLGASGTGKSTLINTLLGEDRQKTGEIRADGRGRHTTVTRELLTLPGGAFLIDTPGIRIAGLWEGVGDTFADVEELALGCRFSDCGHTTEPGCAVREALPPERIEAWRKLQEELAAVGDRRAKSGRR
jgi:ribosome biogenesis GTPase